VNIKFGYDVNLQYYKYKQYAEDIKQNYTAMACKKEQKYAQKKLVIMCMQTERCGKRSQNMVTARNPKEWD